MKTLIKKCSVCGKKIRVKIYNNRHYSGGQYFGKIKIPLKISNKPYKYTKVGNKKYGVVKVLKYGKEIEYWECPECYKEKS